MLEAILLEHLRSEIVQGYLNAFYGPVSYDIAYPAAASQFPCDIPYGGIVIIQEGYDLQIPFLIEVPDRLQFGFMEEVSNSTSRAVLPPIR